MLACPVWSHSSIRRPRASSNRSRYSGATCQRIPATQTSTGSVILTSEGITWLAIVETRGLNSPFREEPPPCLRNRRSVSGRETVVTPREVAGSHPTDTPGEGRDDFHDPRVPWE